MKKVTKLVPALNVGRRGGHLAYFAGVFVEGHGFYVYAALGLLIVEAVLWALGQQE